MGQWSGVFPAATTQFKSDESLDLDATQQVIDGLVRDGVHGVVCLGTVGENLSLSAAEKRRVAEAVKESVGGRVPVLAGVSEYTSREAVQFTSDVARAGLDGIMLLPCMVYHSNARETVHHFRSVAEASDVPIMVYNNAVLYGTDMTVDMFAEVADLQTITSIKESSDDPRRITDLTNRFGDRFTIFSGVDDIALESLLVGAKGWVSGLTNVFPAESVALYDLARAGRYDEAMELYRWFMPLLHLDARTSLVQCIKLAAEMVGRGTETVRTPRLVLEGPERDEVVQIVEQALASRPALAA